MYGTATAKVPEEEVGCHESQKSAHQDPLGMACAPHRIGTVRALSLDETLFKREGRWRTQCWSTRIVDARSGQLLEIVQGRDSTAPAQWLDAQPDDWLSRVRWAVMDMSGPYKAVFDTMVPEAEVVIDSFHVVKHANSKLDECRRRVQNETLGHRGRKADPSTAAASCC